MGRAQISTASTAVADLLATADAVEPFDGQPGKSGASLFRVRNCAAVGADLVLKYLDPAHDWTDVLAAAIGAAWRAGRGAVAGDDDHDRFAARAFLIAAFPAMQKLLIPSGFGVNLRAFVYGQTRQT